MNVLSSFPSRFHDLGTDHLISWLWLLRLKYLFYFCFATNQEFFFWLRDKSNNHLSFLAYLVYVNMAQIVNNLFYWLKIKIILIFSLKIRTIFFFQKKPQDFKSSVLIQLYVLFPFIIFIRMPLPHYFETGRSSPPSNYHITSKTEVKVKKGINFS